MKKINSCLLVVICLLAFSCKKETTNISWQSSANENAELFLAEEASWQGAFLSYNGLPPSRFIPDSLFIANGYARIYSDSVRINRQNYYSTLIRVIVPAYINIKGDSINFEAGLKNPLNSAFYSPEHGRDIKMYIRGESNQAFINNVATSDVDPTGLGRAAIRMGQTVRNNLPTLQYNFEQYGTLILQTFNHGVVAYRNDAYLNGLGYGREPNIGRLKEIGIVFKGSGSIDYIKIYNSVDGQLLMSEDFNKDGQSSIIWY